MLSLVITLLTFIEVLAALLLIGIILIQQSKVGGGLGAMGGGMTETVFGTSAGNVLTKGTIVLASVFLGVSLLVAVLVGFRNSRQERRFEGLGVGGTEVPAVMTAEPATDVDADVGDGAEEAPGESAPAAAAEAAGTAPESAADTAGAAAGDGAGEEAGERPPAAE